MNLAMLDALAVWWREQLEADKATTMPGGPGWNDLLAKLAIIRRYEDARAQLLHADATVEALGWVMRRLAFGQYAGRPGWIHAWRADSR